MFLIPCVKFSRDAACTTVNTFSYHQNTGCPKKAPLRQSEIKHSTHQRLLLEDWTSNTQPIRSYCWKSGQKEPFSFRRGFTLRRSTTDLVANINGSDVSQLCVLAQILNWHLFTHMLLLDLALLKRTVHDSTQCFCELPRDSLAQVSIFLVYRCQQILSPKPVERDPMRHRRRLQP